MPSSKVSDEQHDFIVSVCEQDYDHIKPLVLARDARLDREWREAYCGPNVNPDVLGPKSPTELRVFVKEAEQVDRDHREHERARLAANCVPAAKLQSLVEELERYAKDCALSGRDAARDDNKLNEWVDLGREEAYAAAARRLRELLPKPEDSLAAPTVTRARQTAPTAWRSAATPHPAARRVVWVGDARAERPDACRALRPRRGRAPTRRKPRRSSRGAVARGAAGAVSVTPDPAASPRRWPRGPGRTAQG